MSQIQRYEASRYSGMIKSDKGCWVKHSDYEALQRENERLKAEVEHVHRPGWYLVSADTKTWNGSQYQRDGEANSSANCMSWYESAVFWRDQAERLKAPVSDEEYDALTSDLLSWRESIDAMIASRATQPAPQEPK